MRYQMIWILWIVIFAVSCVRSPVVLKGEDIHGTESCVCYEVDNLEDYLLVGKKKVAQWSETLIMCEMVLESDLDTP